VKRVRLLVTVCTAVVVAALAAVALLRQQHKDVAAGAAESFPWSYFSFLGASVPPGDKPAPRLKVESLENASDLYASFLAARATGRPEMVYEAMNLLSGCASAGRQAVAVAQSESSGTVFPPEYAEAHRKSVAAIQEFNRRCRGFDVVRDKQALRKQLWQQAASGQTPLARILKAEGYLTAYSVSQDPQLQRAIADGLRTGDRGTIELAVNSIPLAAARKSPAAAAALEEASRSVFGANGLWRFDTEFRRLHLCSMGVCDGTDSFVIPDDQRDSPEAKDYSELVGLYETALRSADVDAIMYARPSRFSGTTTKAEEP
jgi:hypothetical protein